VVAPVALADNNGFQQAPTAAGAALGEDVTREIVKIIEQKHKELVESITKMMNEKTAALEKSLAEKDKRIAGLEKELGRLKKELAAAAKPPAPPKPKPEPKPTNAFLGVGHIDNEAGALVTTVHPGSPAAVAGMKEDDLIVAVNGKKVNSESLGGAVTLHAPGTTITLEYMRGGKKAKAEVKLVDRDAFFAARSRKDSAEKEPGDRHSGPILQGKVVSSGRPPDISPIPITIPCTACYWCGASPGPWKRNRKPSCRSSLLESPTTRGW
jgi:C-terminal processing protease CtpA/Prc